MKEEDFKTGKSDKGNPIVGDILKLISQAFKEKSERDKKNSLMKDFHEAALAADPVAPRKKIRSKKFWQVYWKAAADLKLLDFRCHGVQRPEWEETLVTESLGAVLKKANWHGSFKQKGGGIASMVAYGDFYKLISASNDSNYPVRFIPITNSNLYVPTDSTGFRTGSRPVRKAAVVFTGTWGEFNDLFPDAKKKGAGVGMIPRDENFLSATDQNTTQAVEGDTEKDRTEWCYFFDLDKKIACTIVGSACTIIDLKQGKDFKYYFDDDEGRKVYYIPISNYMCIPALEGFYNHGLFELIYDLASNDEGLFNQSSGYINEVAWPQEYVNLPQKRAAKFFRDWQASEDARENGYRAPIPIEVDENGKGGEILTRSNIRQGVIGEVVAFMDRQDLELKRSGIHLDEPEANATATQILADIQTAKLLNVLIMEGNSEEIKFELMVVLDMIKKFVSSKDKTKLQVTTKIQVPDKEGNMIELKADELTLGQLRNTLRENEYFPVINDKSGAVPSNVMRRAEYQVMLPYLDPGSAERQGAVKEFARLHNLDLDFSPLPPAPGAAPAPGAPVVSTPPPIPTDGLGVPFPSPKNVAITS